MADIPKTLKKLEQEGELAAIDIAMSKFLKETGASVADEILILAALISYKYRAGDVCLELNDASLTRVLTNFKEVKLPPLENLLTLLKQSSVVGSPGEFMPLILEDDQRLYFHKLWVYEKELAEMILKRSEIKTNKIESSNLKQELDQLFPTNDSDKNSIDWQKVAALSSVLNRFTVISGGPGTGKTTTVVRILALLVKLALENAQEISVALAAPTGKAASRLKSSIADIKDSLSVSSEIKDMIPDEAVTIHQLLGARRYSSRHKYNEENPLPYDVLIVDEASMIDQVLMSKLMKALLADTRLILLGDKDQLASVEAGSVLRNVCNNDNNSISAERGELLATISMKIPSHNIENHPSRLTDNIVLLQKNYRFKSGGGIAILSDLIKKGKAEEAASFLDQVSSKEVSINEIDEWKDFSKELENLADNYIKKINNCTKVSDYFKSYSEQGLLAAHRKGFLGIDFLNDRFEEIIKKRGGISGYQEWYEGRPIIINRNSYNLGLFNGDIGVCAISKKGEWKINFEKSGDVLSIAPSRLPEYDLAYALTIHKSQGSEFDEVLLVLPNEHSKLLTRELIYTGITRARNKVEIYGSVEVLKQGIREETRRSSGLKNKLW